MGLNETAQMFLKYLPVAGLTTLAPDEFEVVNAIVRRPRGKRDFEYVTLHRAFARLKPFWDTPPGKDIRAVLQSCGFLPAWTGMSCRDRVEAINVALALLELEAHRLMVSCDTTVLEIVNLVRQAKGKPDLTPFGCRKSLDKFWDTDRGQRLKPLANTPFWAEWSRISQRVAGTGEMFHRAERLAGMLVLAEGLLPEPAWERGEWIDWSWLLQDE
jgi:hypothetical protein